jgi:hypothetical protein
MATDVTLLTQDRITTICLTPLGWMAYFMYVILRSLLIQCSWCNLLKVYVYNLLSPYEFHFRVNFLECIHFYIFSICMKSSLLHATSDVFFAYST